MKWHAAGPGGILIALATLAALAGCSEGGPSEPDSPSYSQETPPGLAISDPTGGSNSLAALSATDQSLVYVSASPGSFLDAVSVTITNLANGSSLSASIEDGGFDPVALPAKSGDEVEIVVRFPDGATVSYRATVPPRRRPRVVRTRPPKGDTDVALNTSAAVVFSEPVDGSTATEATVQLRLAGDLVEGSLTLGEDGLQAEFVPAEPLQPGSEYTLVVTQEVLDLDGDSLEEEVHATFTTVGPPLSNPTQIAFTSWRDGNAEIYVMNPDGTGQVNLTNSPDDDYDPVWSPDGSKIAFHSSRDSDPEIYVMNADGTGQVNLTNWPGLDRQPTWSPDGSKIAFESERDGAGDIYVINVNGTALVNLTNHVYRDGEPVWSPDSWEIAFVSWHSNTGDDVFVINADGTGEPECNLGQPCYCWVNLTTSPGDDYNPVWSPDGSKIAFHSSRDGGDHEVYVMNADGTGQVNVTNSPGSDYDPVWSPDGSKIGFRSLRDGNAEIYVINPDGTGLVNLTNSPAYEYDQAWSPDGTKIAFHSLRDGNREIYVMNADGTGLVNLTNSPRADAAPAWRPR